MKNDDILKAAQKDKGIHNEQEDAAFDRSQLIGSFAAFILGLALVITKYIKQKTFCFPLLSVFLFGYALQCFVHWKNTKQLVSLIMGIFTFVLAIPAIILAFEAMIK